MKHLLFLILLFQTFFTLQAVERKELLLNLDKINSLYQDMARENKQWQEEKKTLQLQLKLMQESLGRSSEDGEKLAEKLLRLKEEYASLQKSSSEFTKKILNTKKVILSSIGNLEKQVDVLLPVSLKALILNESQTLKDLQGDKTSRLIDLLSASRDYFNVVIDLQKNVHLVKDVFVIKDVKQQVTVLYVGTMSGFYITQNEDAAGRVVLREKAWKAEPDNSLLATIQKSIKQFNRAGKPALVSLPIQGAKK